MVLSFKQISYVLFFVSGMIGHSNDLHAAQNDTATDNDHEKTITKPDKFIRKFLQRISSDKVVYNGKTLTLYKTMNRFDIVGPILGMTISLGFALFALSEIGDSNSPRGEVVGAFIGATIALVLYCICGKTLIENLHYIYDEPTLLNIDDVKITYDGKDLYWNKVDRIRTEIIRTYGEYGIEVSRKSVISLCDEYLDTLMKLDNIDSHSPITVNNLIAIMEHYLEKSRQDDNEEE